MVRHSHERILLIGDNDRHLSGVLAQALPGVAVRNVSTVFDGVAELAQDRYSAIFTATEPIERRPEAAIRALRELAGDSRLLLFGNPSLEPLSQRMLQFGCDDYLVTPASAGEVQQIFGSPPMRLRPAGAPASQSDPSPASEPPAKDDAPEKEEAQAVENIPSAGAAGVVSAFSSLPIADVLLEALLHHPGDTLAAMVRNLSNRLSEGMQLVYTTPAVPAPSPPEGSAHISHPIAGPAGALGSIHLFAPAEYSAAASAFLAQLAEHLSKAAGLQERHQRLQKLAFTDELTGLFNGRYFKHFLTRTLADARRLRFPVTLFLFDIDNFKSYNDRFGHAAGDDILRQSGELMRRCVRDHDLVARISGDEFAVVFWEKEGPRMPREPNTGVPGRPPSEPRQILERFRRLLETQDFPLLGPAAKGKLTISGGLAVFPYDAQDVSGLIDAADKALMFGAKRSGRNSITLVGGEQSPGAGATPGT